jgi:hypothetical protein
MRRRQLLALAVLAVGVGRAAHAAEPFRTIKWEDLVPKDWDPLKEFKGQDLGSGLSDADPKAQALLKRLREIWDAAPTVPALDGQRVRLPGFVVPLDESPEGLRSLLLVPYFGACIHTPPPPANQILFVRPAKPLQGVRSMDAVWAQGTLHTERNDSAMGASSYRLDGASFEPYVEKRR